jgi:hypothetical protein
LKELSMLEDRMPEQEPAPKDPTGGKLADALTAPLSDYVRSAADYTRELADKLEGQKADDLIASALSWSRRQPLLLIGGGIVLGVILSQLVKSGRAGAPSVRSTEN